MDTKQKGIYNFVHNLLLGDPCMRKGRATFILLMMFQGCQQHLKIEGYTTELDIETVVRCLPPCKLADVKEMVTALAYDQIRGRILK